MTEVESIIKALEAEKCNSCEFKHNCNLCGYNTIIEALREQAEREKGCEYCNKLDKKFVNWHELEPLYGAFEGDYGEYSIDDSDAMLMFHFLDKHTDDTFKVNISVCPMCGRKLEAEQK